MELSVAELQKLSRQSGALAMAVTIRKALYGTTLPDSQIETIIHDALLNYESELAATGSAA